ncbi:MAG: phosphonate metabolism protein/1,5-bisphosphokinase (PRPP-forming) PhnN [Burkholderiales bacterium]|nr:phosphonate metabolism protein/1,5-bisphosphokinase (PRPP-forming) PhnN [Burkholderiales bacterium]MCE7876718.1 phosphonate metabolism protein/1,5-bisphosphokinase (PRPP-forming) PhnN [Betaproteobacteria bacterium PRO3]
MRPGSFFLVVGPSGVGKDTLIDGARAAFAADPSWVFATRTITRPADAGGEVHEAMDDDAFVTAERAGAFLITWSAHGHRYGLRSTLRDELRAGRNVIANGSRATIAELAKRVPRLVVVAVDAKRESLGGRIAGRGREQGEAISARLDRRVELELPAGVERVDVANDGTIEEGITHFLAALTAASRRLRVVRYPVDTWRERVVYLPPASIVGSAAYLGSDRVEIAAGDRKILATVHVADTEPRLADDDIGLSRQAYDDLGVPAGTRVDLRRAAAPATRDMLRAKLRGTALSEAEYGRLLRDVVEGRYAPGEVAAFLVAATQRLTDDEVVALARVRSTFMTPMRWDEPIVVDKHSMGGVPGSRITLIVIPIVAAHGLAIPKTSSRAITSAAGTADAMEVLARVDLTADEVRATVRRARGCIAWNGRLNHSTLDDVMNAITRPLGIDSNRWSVASILSKKLTAGSTHVIIDLPYGPQAKLRTRDEAAELGRLFERVGTALGLVVEAHATDGSAPIGRGIGPSLEVRDVLQVLDHDPAAPRDLAAKAVDFASRILAWDPRVGTVEAGRARAEELLRSGAARERFDAIVEAQGRHATPSLPGAFVHAVHAQRSGKVESIDIARVSEIARRAGAPLDKSAGVDLAARVGDPIRRGDTLYTIHASATAELEAAADLAVRDSGIH